MSRPFSGEGIPYMIHLTGSMCQNQSIFGERSKLGGERSIDNGRLPYNVVDTYYDEDNLRGYTYIAWDATGTYADWVYVQTNRFYEAAENWNDYQRRGVCAHEFGHAHVIGHIPNSFSEEVLMLQTIPDITYHDVYYAPQDLDIQLVNQIYR